MKNTVVCTVLGFLLCSCAVKKNLETTAPFKIGEPFGQKWLISGDQNSEGYELIVPIVSLNEDDAVLHNIYHRGEMVPLKIEMRKIGLVAVAEFSTKERLTTPQLADGEPFPFSLGEAEAVLSYLQKKKVRYIKINGIRQNPTVTFPSMVAKRNN